jgi:hypothetical protein
MCLAYASLPSETKVGAALAAIHTGIGNPLLRQDFGYIQEIGLENVVFFSFSLKKHFWFQRYFPGISLK